MSAYLDWVEIPIYVHYGHKKAVSGSGQLSDIPSHYEIHDIDFFDPKTGGELSTLKSLKDYILRVEYEAFQRGASEND